MSTLGGAHTAIMAPQKSKGQKMALGDFLQDSSLGSWADEMEDMPMPSSTRPAYGGDRSFSSTPAYGSTSSYADRGYSMREQLPLPTKPPYTVHLGNMSFDATEGDVQDLFQACQVTSVRIVEDKLDRKPKGFGYAEFATLDGLKKALDFNGTQFQGRNIRVSVAEPQKERPDARELNDWTRKGPLPDIGGARRVSDRGGFNPASRGFDNVSEAGSERGGRRGYGESETKVRDFGNWDRKGPLTPTLPNAPPARNFDRPVSRDGPLKERRNSPAWGEGRSQDGSRPPRREFVERPVIDRAPTAPELDNQWRSKMRPDPPAAPAPANKSPALSTREASTPSSPVTTPAPPATRPKLNLQKRTVSEAPDAPAASPAIPDAKVSPFGAARPIDTAAREKEVEEKRQIALREKREAEEKAREEKKVAEEKAKEEQKLAKEAERAAKAERADEEPPAKSSSNGTEKDTENGVTSPTAGKNYEILRRTANEDMSTADEEVEEGDANGNIIDDKAIKPKEIVRDMKDGETKVNGTSTQQPETNVEPSAESLENDGWSTVPSKARNNRKTNNPAARAIAS